MLKTEGIQKTTVQQQAGADLPVCLAAVTEAAGVPVCGSVRRPAAAPLSTS